MMFKSSLRNSLGNPLRSDVFCQNIPFEVMIYAKTFLLKGKYFPKSFPI